jgi:hypothetical protein
MKPVFASRSVYIAISFIGLCLSVPATRAQEQVLGTHIHSKSIARILGKTKTSTQDDYISADGTRFARYIDGGKEIRITHLQKNSGIQYIYEADNQDGWYSLDALGSADGVHALNLFDRRSQQKNGQPQFMGESKIADLPCKKFMLKNTISWCNWQAKQTPKAIPASIALQSRMNFPNGDYSETIVQWVKFNTQISLDKLNPPDDVLKKRSATKDTQNPTNAWCLAEKKKTGTDPCQASDEDDEEAWDVE